MSDKADHSGQSGFTLIEVLAALVIFSVSILGLISSITHATQTATTLEQRTFASIVVENQIALFRADCRQSTAAIASQTNDPTLSAGLACNRLGETTGEQSIFDQSYAFTLDTRETDHERIRELTVSIFDDDILLLDRTVYFQTPTATSPQRRDDNAE